jgi:hypothetical protein
MKVYTAYKWGLNVPNEVQTSQVIWEKLEKTDVETGHWLLQVRWHLSPGYFLSANRCIELIQCISLISWQKCTKERGERMYVEAVSMCWLLWCRPSGRARGRWLRTLTNHKIAVTFNEFLSSNSVLRAGIFSIWRKGNFWHVWPFQIYSSRLLSYKYNRFMRLNWFLAFIPNRGRKPITKKKYTDELWYNYTS